MIKVNLCEVFAFLHFKIGGSFMMKRLLALALCLLTVVLPLASCGGSIAMDAEDKGDIINAYITGDIYAFDPGKDITDESAVNILCLI